jgi:hypothetical protein
LARLREVPLERVLEALCLHVSVDRDFIPVKDTTQRWYVSAGPGVTELLVTGTKWFDVREKTGGGGGIDLVMHLLQLGFVDAVRRLTGAGL